MGRGAGGGASGRMGSGSRSGTEGGYSAAMRNGVLNAEKSISGNNYESLIAFDSKGNIIYQAKGGKDWVRYDRKQVKDAVVTHNHPRGSAFSSEDLVGMVESNMKEMRITSKNFTYSMKRPKKGWGATPVQVSVETHVAHQKTLAAYKSMKTGNSKTDKALWAKLTTASNQAIAQTFGWNFTVKNN